MSDMEKPIFKNKCQYIPLWQVTQSNSDTWYGAMLREPVGRWISGFATYLQLRIQHNKCKLDDIKRLLSEKETLDHIFKTIAFEEHTKPQHLFIYPVADRVNCFTAQDRPKLYRWLKLLNFNCKDEALHHVENFGHAESHYIIYKIIQDLIFNNTDYHNAVINFYRKDTELYERAKTDDQICFGAQSRV